MTPGYSHRFKKKVMRHVLGEKISSLLILLWYKPKRLKFGHGYCINEQRDDEHNSTNMS
jgi:hypothetical protein